MIEIFPDLLRGIISTTANVLLMASLLQPKYSKKVTLLTMLGVLAADLGTAIYCYLSGNLTLLSKLDIILFAVLCTPCAQCSRITSCSGCFRISPFKISVTP